MAETSDIDWTQATWNVITGCSVISPGCKHCYAMKLAGGRLRNHPSRKGLTTPTKSGPVWTGEVRFNKGWLDQPLLWQRPRMIFPVAHGDLFHEAVPDEQIDQVFAVMALARHHSYQVATKRPDRAQRYMDERWQPAPAQVIAGLSIPAEKVGEGRRSQVERACEPLLEKFALADTENAHLWDSEQACIAMKWQWPLPHVWIGTSIEDQPRADERRDPLAALARAGWNTWVSYEPALGLVDWRTYGFIKWLVSGGESGSEARPSHPDWHRAARNFCLANGIPYFFKQWGNWLHQQQHDSAGRLCGKVWHGGEDGERAFGWADGFDSIRLSKSDAGHYLDGGEWRQYPEGMLRQ